MNLKQLTDYILEKVKTKERTDYMRVFCNLQLETDKIIAHGFGDYPVIDLYQLDYFPVVCSKGDNPGDAIAEWVQFYLYHSDEQRLRIPPSTVSIDIETKPKFRIRWWDLVKQLEHQGLLKYTDKTSLDDLDTDFWGALFSDKKHNDEFDPDAYCHSPWFEKCCGEKRSVADLRDHGDLDNIFLKIKPQKTNNYPYLPNGTGTTPNPEITPEPTNVRVSHLDFDTVALRLLSRPAYPASLTPSVTPGTPGTPPPPILQLPESFRSRLSVMAVLKA